MAKKLNSVLGIDIGSQKIKVAEVKTQGKEPVVTALGMIDTPEGAVDHTGVYNSDAVGIAIKQLLHDSGASSGTAIVSVAGQASVLVRTLEVPRMSDAELSEHMQWEINRNIPFAESTVESDYRPLPDEDPSSPNMEVVMAIAPRSAIDTIIACMKKAGKGVAAIDVEPMGFARSLQISYDDLYHEKSVCVVDIGHKTTSINIFKDGKLLLPRQVPLGGEMFTQKISEELGCTMEDAEELKRTKAVIPESAAAAPAMPDFNLSAPPGATQEFQAYNPFAEDLPTSPFGEGGAPSEPMPVPVQDVSTGDPQSDRIWAAIAPIVDEFVCELRRSIDYFRSKGGEIDQLVLCGGGAKLNGLPEFIHNSFGLPCDRFDPLRRLNMNLKKNQAPVDEHREEFAVAIGNGLHIFF